MRVGFVRDVRQVKHNPAESRVPLQKFDDERPVPTTIVYDSLIALPGEAA